MSSFIGLKVSEIKHRDVFICGGCNLNLTLPDGNTIRKRKIGEEVYGLYY